MISIVHVIWSGKFGGIEKLVIDLCTAQKKNHEVHVELMIAKELGDDLEKLSKFGIVHHFIGLKSGFDLSPSKFKRIKKLFSQFDIIHIHSFSLMFAWAAIGSRKKIVFTEHGNFGFGRKKKLFDRINYFLLERFLKKNVNYISFNSKFTEKIAKKRYKLKKQNCEVVYNGIDFSEPFSNENSDQELKKKLENKFVVGTSSRFAGFKRTDRLMKSFAEFERGKNTILLLVGDGVLRKELEQLSHLLKINERTIFTGYRKDVRQLQQMMDVCVFPSENEPFGLVAIEAWSLGKPVVVFRDGGGITELVEKISKQDVVTDVKSLVRRMEFYYNHRDEIQNGMQARIQFAKTFDIKTMEEKFYNIYKRII